MANIIKIFNNNITTEISCDNENLKALEYFKTLLETNPVEIDEKYINTKKYTFYINGTYYCNCDIFAFMCNFQNFDYIRKLFLTKVFDINELCIFGEIMYPIELVYNNNEILKFLLENTVINCRKRDDFGETILQKIKNNPELNKKLENNYLSGIYNNEINT